MLPGGSGLRDDDAEDGTGPAGAPVGDVEGLVGTEGHPGGYVESGDDIDDGVVWLETNDFAVAGRGIAGGIGQFERIEQAVIPELQADDGGEAGAGVGDAELADLRGFGSRPGVVSRKTKSFESVTMLSKVGVMGNRPSSPT